VSQEQDSALSRGGKREKRGMYFKCDTSHLRAATRRKKKQGDDSTLERRKKKAVQDSFKMGAAPLKEAARRERKCLSSNTFSCKAGTRKVSENFWKEA